MVVSEKEKLTDMSKTTHTLASFQN